MWRKYLSIFKILVLALCVLVLPAFDASVQSTEALYQKLDLAKAGLNHSAFEKALQGWVKLDQQSKLNKRHLLAIADLSQSANAKRLYILDLEKEVLLFQTYVAHGRNSGEEYAKTFSNAANSYQSSLGFYTTGSTYFGKHGLSLRLMGMEPSINDYAEERAIVIHGADYVSEKFIQKNGRLGRSLGCPAVSQELCEPIITALKEGACFFIYHPNQDYAAKSILCKN